MTSAEPWTSCPVTLSDAVAQGTHRTLEPGGVFSCRVQATPWAAPVTIATLAQNGNYSSTPIVNQEGFSQQTLMNVSGNNFLSPATTFSDPFPGGAIVQPNGSAVGLTTFLGSNVSFLNPQMKSPYSARWNFGFQQSIGQN